MASMQDAIDWMAFWLQDQEDAGQRRRRVYALGERLRRDVAAPRALDRTAGADAVRAPVWIAVENACASVGIRARPEGHR